VFTDLAGRVLLRLPLAVAIIGLGLLLTIALVLAWRRAALGRPLLLAAAMVVGGSLAAGFVSFIATLLRTGDFWRAYPLITYLAVYATLLAAMAAIWARWCRGLDRRRARTAAWLLVLIFGALISFVLPGATIFFLIAPAIALVAIALPGRAARTATLLAVIAIVVQFVMFAELLAAVEMLLIDGPLAAVVLLAALAALPAIIEVDPNSSRAPALVLIAGALALWIAALTMPRASAERPVGFSIDYFRDSDAKSASWAVATKQAPLPDNFPGRWERKELPYNGRLRWASPAPLLETPVAAARVISAARDAAGRRLRLALSPGGANSVSIRFAKGANVLALGLAGAAIPLPRDGEPEKPVLRCTGRSCEGLQVDVLLGDRRPVEVELFSTQFGLPPESRPLVAARPRNAIPQYAPDSTITMSRIRL
jgi:hypothetical protein